jgi:hypothetical protein
VRHDVFEHIPTEFGLRKPCLRLKLDPGADSIIKS